MRILLVEDDPMIGDAIQRALSDASYAADWVKNGLTGLAALDTTSTIWCCLIWACPARTASTCWTASARATTPCPC